MENRNLSLCQKLRYASAFSSWEQQLTATFILLIKFTTFQTNGDKLSPLQRLQDAGVSASGLGCTHDSHCSKACSSCIYCVLAKAFGMEPFLGLSHMCRLDLNTRKGSDVRTTPRRFISRQQIETSPEVEKSKLLLPYAVPAEGLGHNKSSSQSLCLEHILDSADSRTLSYRRRWKPT